MGILQDEAERIRTARADASALARANRPLLWAQRWDDFGWWAGDKCEDFVDWINDNVSVIAFFIIVAITIGGVFAIMHWDRGDEAYPSAYSLTAGYLTQHPQMLPFIKERLETNGILTLSEWYEIQDRADEIEAKQDEIEFGLSQQRARADMQKALDEAKLVLGAKIR